jgi:cytochrome b6-f complex iron-sulfur subunit
MELSHEEKITRTKFLKDLGLSGAAIFAATYCAGTLLTSCKNAGDVTAAGSTITADLTTATYSKLTAKNTYVIINSSIVLAHTSDDTYVAVPLTCSHEGQLQVTYRTGEFYCTAHGARFSNAGVGLNSEGRSGLKLYTVSKSGNVITITT